MAEASDRRLRDAFEHEAFAGLVLTTRLRVAGAGIIALWTLIENQGPGRWYFFGIPIALVALGFLPLALRRAGVRGAWPLYLSTALDLVVFTIAVLYPGDFDPVVVPPQVRTRYGNEQYLFLFVLNTALLYRPALVVWVATMAALVWAIGIGAIFAMPGTVAIPLSASWLSVDDLLGIMLHPGFVPLNQLGRTVVLVLVSGGVLAVFVRRTQHLVERQVEAERARGNLARYFSPNVVDELARSDEPLRATRQQPVAVLFVDLVGFTRRAADETPAAVIAFLREFHARMVSAVFAHGGTVDKYLGDGLMVTFGTPRAGPHDATNALACARAMLSAVDAWNAEPSRRDAPPIRVGIGVHHGPVVLGDIGDERHLEFAVVGSTVNVASRLEHRTRDLGVRLVASDAVVEQARREGAPEAVFVGLADGGRQTLPGVPEPVRVWTSAG